MGGGPGFGGGVGFGGGPGLGAAWASAPVPGVVPAPADGFSGRPADGRALDMMRPPRRFVLLTWDFPTRRRFFPAGGGTPDMISPLS